MSMPGQSPPTPQPMRQREPQSQPQPLPQPLPQQQPTAARAPAPARTAGSGGKRAGLTIAGLLVGIAALGAVMTGVINLPIGGSDQAAPPAITATATQSSGGLVTLVPGAETGKAMQMLAMGDADRAQVDQAVKNGG